MTPRVVVPVKVVFKVLDCFLASPVPSSVHAFSFQGAEEAFHGCVVPAVAPAAHARGCLRFLEALHLSPLYKWVYETASTDSFVSIEKAERVLGYKPKYSNKDALVRNYEWYIANMAQFEHASGVSHRVPWKQGILKLAKVFF